MHHWTIALLFAATLAGAPQPSRHHFNLAGPLTGASSRPPVDIALEFIRQVAPEHGAVDVASIYLVKQYRSDHNGVTHLVFRQQYAGLDVKYSEFVVNVDSAGRVLNAGGNLYAAPDAHAAPPRPESLSPSIRAAMKWADPIAQPDFTPMEVGGSGKLRRFRRMDGTGDIAAQAVWFPQDGRLVPAWEFLLPDAAAVIHSESETVLDSRPLVYYQAPPPPRGLVFTGPNPRPNPRPGFWMEQEPPYVPRVLASFQGDPQASPAGWVEGTETAGNNVIAGKNPLGLYFLGEPVTAKSETRDFQFPLEVGPGAPNPSTYVDAAITNLFYWLNRSHDLFWHIGFNEAAGNFQKRNFGRGGFEGDPIYGYAQFGVQQLFGATLRSAFYTQLGTDDGSPAMIAMFLGAGDNGVFTDGSLDAEVIVHEYGHGVSNRLVRNLGGHHGGSMGEGWSDYFALDFTTPEGAPPDGVYATGDYFLQRLNVGVRTRPYSTDMNVNPVTFADLGHVTDVPAIHHDAGIWVTALFEVRANLIRQFGEREGRRRANLLVIDGMKLAVPGPSMVDARDGILLADRVTFRGESQMQIWQAFAKRGLGATAYSPGNNSTRVRASFETSSRTASLAFAESSYELGEPVRVLLHDANLAGDVAVLQLTSFEAGRDIQTVRLRRSGNIFTGTIGTSNGGATEREDGVLSVLPGSVISAYYADADAEGGAKLIEASVAMRPSYVRRTVQPASRTGDERPLNLRGSASAFVVHDFPFAFPFYGRNYSSARIYANGLIAFDVAVGTACTDVQALRQITAVAPLYGSFRTSGSAQPNENVFVSQPSPDAITFRWAAETNPSPGVANPEAVNFSATLYQDGRIEFQYGAGNRNVTVPTATSSVCTATPSIGISSGNGASANVVTNYIGRSNLENASGVLFEPPFGASSAPEIRIEVPNSVDPYQGLLNSQIVVSDANHTPSVAYILMDGVLRGALTPSGLPAVCNTERLPNCVGFRFAATFEDLRLTPGQHTMTVRALNSRGAMGERTVTFTVAEGQSRVPVTRIESPAAGAELSGNLTIRGYAAVPDLRVLAVDVVIDGVSYGSAVYGLPRADVCGSLGFTSPSCPNIGFTFTLDSLNGRVPLPNGDHQLQVRVWDESGRLTLYPETPLTFRVNNAPNEAPRGVLVTPANAERVSGNILVWGYAWDPDGHIRSVELLVDGFPRATLRYGDPRPDQCAALSGVAACPNIGFAHEFNTRTVLNGPHVLGIRLTDDRGRVVTIPQNAANGLTINVAN